MANLQSILLLLFLLTASVYATTIQCVCLCDGKQYSSIATVTTCSGVCITSVKMWGGEQAACPSGRIEYLEVGRNFSWIEIGGIVVGSLLLLACCVSAICCCTKRGKSQSETVDAKW